LRHRWPSQCWRWWAWRCWAWRCWWFSLRVHGTGNLWWCK
jgi:hypothetical protein